MQPMASTPQGPDTPSTTDDARVGRCPQCGLFTYDVEGLSEEEVRRLVLDTEGRVLTRFVRRTDGRMMSLDCGHGTVPNGSTSRTPMLVVAVFGVVVAVGTWWTAYPSAADSIVAELPVEPPQKLYVESTRPPPAPPPPLVAPREVPAPAPRTTVHLANVYASWALNTGARLALAEDLGRRLGPAQACFELTALNEPELRGSLTLTADYRGEVTPRRVRTLEDHLDRANVADCVTAAIKLWTFDKPRTGLLTAQFIFARE
jgi:hypothetical protein